MAKRSDYLSWDEYFMGIALLSSYRSKDPNTQVGACIVNEHNKIMSVGYNGKISVRLSRRAQRDPEQRRRIPAGLPHLCCAVPLQRMRESDHSMRDP